MIKRKKRRFRASVAIVLILVALILAGASSYMIDYSLGYPQQERNSAEHWQDRIKDECPWTTHWMDSVYQNHCVKDTFVTMPSGYRAHAIYLYSLYSCISGLQVCVQDNDLYGLYSAL